VTGDSAPGSPLRGRRRRFGEDAGDAGVAVAIAFRMAVSALGDGELWRPVMASRNQATTP
jgi:hypothetical protein